MNNGAMLNAYPDSLGGNLSQMAALLETEDFRDVFRSVYLLPSLYRSDLDRGFSVISYELNKELAAADDLARLKNLGLDLKLDFVLNHLSVQSPQFQDILEKGEDSAFRDFFIDWNRFWEDNGKMDENGVIQPEPDMIKDMFFRKPGLPVLVIPMPDGGKVPYWNTFYQEVTDRGFLGQMDLNVRSEQVWQFYEQVLKTLSGYGAAIARLDAFAYASKIPGKHNFMNEPETWDILERIRGIAAPLGLELLPEIHATYAEGVFRKIAGMGYCTYDFFLPGLMIDAMDRKSPDRLIAWAKELKENHIRTVNMLGCHDGIPMLDLKGLLPDERIQELIGLLVNRGGLVKNLHGKKNMYYQVNMTYFNAMDRNPRRMTLARAIQLFMPGKPQVWYLDLVEGENDMEAVLRAGAGGHKEINRKNLSIQEIRSAMEKTTVREQIRLLRLRNTVPVFEPEADMTAEQTGQSGLRIAWRLNNQEAVLEADLDTLAYRVLVNGKTAAEYSKG